MAGRLHLKIHVVERVLLHLVTIAYRLYTESQNGLHIPRTRYDEDVVDPDSSKRGDTNGPSWRGGQNRHPWHFQSLKNVMFWIRFWIFVVLVDQSRC